MTVRQGWMVEVVGRIAMHAEPLHHGA